MEPIITPDVVTDDSFIHQIKWDGIRGIVHIDNGMVTVHTKNRNDYTATYPELSHLPMQVNTEKAILDGELVVFKGGKPSFADLLKRNSLKSALAITRAATLNPVKYIIFDMLMMDGADLTHKTLIERQDALKSCVSKSSFALVTDSFDNGASLYDLMKQKNMEGIVSKRRESIYSPGKKHNDWFKIKIAKKMLCVITGAKKKNDEFSSILLGIFKDNQLIHIGNIYSGLKQRDILLLKDYMQSNKTDETDDVILVDPKLTCWVKYSDRTDRHSLRHPVLLGFSSEPPENATGEEIVI